MNMDAIRKLLDHYKVDNSRETTDALANAGAVIRELVGELYGIRKKLDSANVGRCSGCRSIPYDIDFALAKAAALVTNKE
jgi:hypothetical protein